MKKLIALSAIYALSIGVVFPALGIGINTSLTRDPGSGDNPIVKVKWEANADRVTDDSTAEGAQFLPSGNFGVNKTISICAVVTDPDGLSDINKVYADVFYPSGIALGSHHKPLDGQSGTGCGGLMQEDELLRLTKAEGIALFCNRVRSENNNLPEFNDSFNYDEICKADGELQKETAAVYCAEKDLSYEDPSGKYRTLVLAQDKSAKDGTLENFFEYLPLTAFEPDFTSVSYGNVKLNTHKIINGNLAFSPGDGMATVRNTGNTRLNMQVSQDDMGFGKTGGISNVHYDARVGSNATFANYDPNQLTTLLDPLDLSEADEMDFSILVDKFPPEHPTNFTGTMTLGAVSAEHLVCAGPTPTPTPQPGGG